MQAIISFFEKIGLIFDPSTAPDFSSYGKEFFIDFKGLGIGQFKMNPVALNLFKEVRWYGILITLGIILAFWYISFRTKQQGIAFDDLLDYVLIVVPTSILGARLFYVFTAEGYDLADWYKIWDGGLAIYGAIIVGALMVYIVSKVKKIRILRMMDCVVPGVMIGQMIGRWGNFCNGEAFGAVTDSVFGMGLSHIAGVTEVTVHPTFLYESLWNLLGFILINIFYNKKKFDGQIVLEYLGWYGLGRFFIELLRQDSLPLKIGSYYLRISCVIGLICFIASLVVFIVFISKQKNPNLKEASYYPGAKRLKMNSQNAVENVKEETSASDTFSSDVEKEVNVTTNDESKEENNEKENLSSDSENNLQNASENPSSSRKEDPSDTENNSKL